MIIYLKPFDRAKMFSRKFIGRNGRYFSNIPIVGTNEVYYQSITIGNQYVPNAPKEYGIFVASIKVYKKNYVLGTGFKYIGTPSRLCESAFAVSPENYFCKFVEEIMKYTHDSIDIDENTRVYFFHKMANVIITDFKKHADEIFERYNKELERALKMLGVPEIKEEMKKLRKVVRYKDIVPPPSMTKRQFVKMLKDKYGERLHDYWVLDYPENCQNKELVQDILKYKELDEKCRKLEDKAHDMTKDLHSSVICLFKE